MLALVAILTSTSLNPIASGYAAEVHSKLSGASKAFLKSAGRDARKLKEPTVSVVEVEIDTAGAVQKLALSRSSGDNSADDLARLFVLTAEPFAPPPAEQAAKTETSICLLRITLSGGKRPKVEHITACFEPGTTLPALEGLTESAVSSGEPAGQLFAGWATEIAGNLAGATAYYEKAVTAAPRWDYAARAMGLALVRQKKGDEAVPYLELYVGRHAPPAEVAAYAREIKRYAQYTKEIEADKQRVRKRLSKNDIASGIKNGYPALEPCLEKARAERKLAVGNDTLLMSWKIRKDGTVHGARLDGPKSLVMTAHAECLAAAVDTWRFHAFADGQEVGVKKAPIPVRGSDEVDTNALALAAAAAELEAQEAAFEEASVSQCARGQDEITAYIQKFFGKLNRCVSAERKRAPTLRLPDKLPIAFVIEPSGMVTKIAIDHRHFRDGPMLACVQKALAGKMAPSDGATCPARFELNLR